MHGDNLSYADTFEKALRIIDPRRKATVADASAKARGRKEDLKRAHPPGKTGIENYLRLQGEGRFPEAAKELIQLREALQRLVRQAE